MLTHYLKIAFRNIWKHKTQSLIGVFSLAFGVACFISAYYWLRYETGYDGFYPDAAHIYRIYSVGKQSGKVNERVPGILETKLHEHFPAIETSAGFTVGYENYSADETPYIRLRTLYADSAFFHLFPQRFISGDARQPLQTSRYIILTETTAIRLFGNVEKAIGQQVSSTIYRFLAPYTVTAVVKDPPPNTNLSFDAIHFHEMENNFISNMPEATQWTFFNKQMYVKLHPRTNTDELAGQLHDFTSRLETNANIELRILPIGDVRYGLNTDLPFTLGFIRLLVAAGLLLLFSAFFNFLNLYLGLFRQRIRELRQRMVSGATGGQIVIQMLFELTCVVLLALALALCLVVTIRPALSGLLDIPVETSQFMYQFMVCGVWVMMLMLLAGTFPLWQLSRTVLRHLTKRTLAVKPVLRRVTVAMQLTVSVVFIVAALVVMMQIRFVNHKDLGFDRNGIVQLSAIPGMHSDALKQKLETIPQIENITENGFEPQHEARAMITDVEWQGKPLHEKPTFQHVFADSRFVEIFRVQMLMGEWWNEGEQRKIVLNEEAVRVMGLSEPIGAIIRMYPLFMSNLGDTPMYEYEVAGVVKDFHTLSLRSRIHPAIFRSGFSDDFYVRVIPGQEQEAMKRISAILPDIDASMADVRMTTLDELFDRLNHSEQVGLKMFSVLATVCLLISLFGIYAVAVASTQPLTDLNDKIILCSDNQYHFGLFFLYHSCQRMPKKEKNAKLYHIHIKYSLIFLR